MRKAIPGYEGMYECAESGEIYSLPRIDASGHHRKGRQMKHTVSRKGYHYVMLCKNGRTKNMLVHKIALETFVGPKPTAMQGRHLDGCKDNNHVVNLKWGTPKENGADRHRHGTNVRHVGALNGMSILTETEAMEILKLGQSRAVSPVDLASRYNVKPRTITAIWNGHAWNHLSNN